MKIRRHIQSNVDPQELVKELVEGNLEYRKEHKGYFENLKNGQAPDVTLVTCCDSRIPPFVFGLDSLNEVFTIRNIGNQFRNSEGSIKYSLFHLKTPILIIMGHTGCGAVQAALGDYREEDDAIQKEVIGLHNSVRIAKEQDVSSEDPFEENSMYAEVNVDHQITKVISEYKCKPMIDSGKLTVIGMMFDIHNVYGVDNAHVHITNINGEQDPSKIKKHKILSKLTDEEKDVIVRRLVNGH